MTETPRLTLQDLFDIHTATFSSTITELVHRRNRQRERWNRDFAKPTEDAYVNGELLHAAIANISWALLYDEETNETEDADTVFYDTFAEIEWDTSKFDPPDNYLDSLMDAGALILAEIERYLRKEVTAGYLPAVP